MAQAQTNTPAPRTKSWVPIRSRVHVLGRRHGPSGTALVKVCFFEKGHVIHELPEQWCVLNPEDGGQRFELTVPYWLASERGIIPNNVEVAA